MIRKTIQELLPTDNTRAVTYRQYKSCYLQTIQELLPTDNTRAVTYRHAMVKSLSRFYCKECATIAQNITRQKWDSSIQIKVTQISTDNKIDSCFSQIHHHISFYFCIDHMFQSSDHQQAIFTKFRIRCMQKPFPCLLAQHIEDGVI